jgi:DNA-binding transcriptional LysR family regulator
MLVALQALLEERNVTLAGTRIGMGQPAMSAALARLRRHYDDKLLLRVGRHYELTPLAQRLLPLVQETVELADRTLKVSTRFDAHTSTRTFTLAVSECALATIVGQLVQAVRECGGGPHVDVEVLPPHLDAGALRVLQLRHDLVILPLGHATVGPTQILYSDNLVCVGGSDNPQLEAGKVSLETLAQLPHAVGPLDQSTLSPAYCRLVELGVEWKSVVRVASTVALPALVADTDLIALVPRRIAQIFGSADRIQIAVLPFEAELTEVMHWHPSRDDDPAHRWLRSAVRRAAFKLIDGGASHGSPGAVDRFGGK